MSKLLDGISQAQRERLYFIDFCLEYFGQISRVDLISHFDIGAASATRDFSLYKKLAAENLKLAHQTKQYYRTDNFTTLFDHNVEQALTQLTSGAFESINAQRFSKGCCSDAIRLIHPNSTVIASLMRAISAKKAILCEYVSVTSGASQREIVPHSLVNNGHRWHVRAFDRKSASFRDFVCNRFLFINLLSEQKDEQESISCDQQWNKLLTLEIIPHPKLAHTQAIALDYGMDNNLLKLPVRAALIGYLTQQWRIDCSNNKHLDCREYHLALRNHEVLNDVENLLLVPGVECE